MDFVILKVREREIHQDEWTKSEVRNSFDRDACLTFPNFRSKKERKHDMSFFSRYTAKKIELRLLAKSKARVVFMFILLSCGFILFFTFPLLFTCGEADRS